MVHMDLQKIECIVIDCDGVLTDGRLNIDHTGSKMFKSFHTRDIRAIRELVSQGFEVYIVSADDWPGGGAFADKVGAHWINERDKSKVKEHMQQREYMAVGDDAWDVPMLKGAIIKFCPQDADASVRRIDGIEILGVAGGAGVIAEVLRFLTRTIKQ
jgi:3-deoxy-D-manno-octulosonate 8-phosphate phosphatase (KDO 8-P phosphatase)